MLRNALLIALAVALPCAHAAAPCNDACQGLIHEGDVLTAQGKYKEALEKYKAAAANAPQSAMPLSHMSGLLEHVSRLVKPEQAEALRKQSEGAARAALQLDANDPVAQETLRMLTEEGPPLLHQPNAAANKALAEAEVLFTQHKNEQALEKYKEVMQLDPQYSTAWVFAGDCYYAQNNWTGAESLYRRATEIEPRNSQAWRFLSDALHNQGKYIAAEQALLSAIAAAPSQLPNWTKLAAMRGAAGLPLKRLQLRRDGVQLGADGKVTISVADASKDQSSTPDSAFRLALALSEASLRSKAKLKLSPFEIELQTWQLAMKIADETKANGGQAPTDPALLQMQAFSKDGQLEPAILLLLYRESYRPELEKWVAAHPDGVKNFINRYGLQP